MIELRTAAFEDSAFIARMVMMALHISEGDNPRLYHHMVELVEDEHTLYHWTRAVIATSSDLSDYGELVPVGVCLAYDGVDYHERREYSFSFVCADGRPVSENNGDLLTQPDESGVGEYYVDSLAVIPECRGKGIGRMLLQDSLKRAAEKNLMPTILVDPNNEPALTLYKSVGFEYSEEMRVFGENYHKYCVL